jgi:hypothetical protein
MNPISSIYKKEVRFIGNIGYSGNSVICSDGNSVSYNSGNSGNNSGNRVNCVSAGRTY